MAVSGELLRGLRLVEPIDAEQPVGWRRSSSGGAGCRLEVLRWRSAKAQLADAECFDDVERLRADRAGAALRAVAGTPSAWQLAHRFRPSHIRAIERAMARAGNELDRRLGRDPSEEVTFAEPAPRRPPVKGLTLAVFIRPDRFRDPL